MIVSVHMRPREAVTPAQAGVHGRWLCSAYARATSMGPRLRGDDDQERITNHPSRITA